MRHRVKNPLECVEVQVRARQLQGERTESRLDRRDTKQEHVQQRVGCSIPQVGVIRKIKVQQVMLLVISRPVRIQHARRRVRCIQLSQDAVRLREVDVGPDNTQLRHPPTRLTTETVQIRIVKPSAERIRATGDDEPLKRTTRSRIDHVLR